MSVATRISVEGLSKAFPLRKRKRVTGLSLDAASAVGTLFNNVFRKPEKAPVPSCHDPAFLYALDDLSFEVPAGQVLGIIGRNGAGKSTLLKILARIIEPSSGRIRVSGRVVSLLDLGVGLAPDLTVRQNIQIQGRLSGIDAGVIAAAEDQILEFARLTEYRDCQLGMCPTGSSIQLAFSTMMNLKAEIILADEVLAVGDSRFRASCEERIRSVGESGESVLFVSHDMNAIKRTCSRVIWIDRGRLVMDGPAAEVVDAYTSQLLAGYFLPEVDETSLVAACRLLDLRLLDSTRSQVGAMEITQGGYVDALVRITEPSVAVFPVIEIWHGKHLALRTSPPAPITVDSPKTMSLAVRIPADFLNESTYRATCTLYVQSLTDPDLEPATAAEENLDFSVLNPSPERSVWGNWQWGRSGVISPRLAWSVDAGRS